MRLERTRQPEPRRAALTRSSLGRGLQLETTTTVALMPRAARAFGRRDRLRAIDPIATIATSAPVGDQLRAAELEAAVETRDEVASSLPML